MSARPCMRAERFAPSEEQGATRARHGCMNADYRGCVRSVWRHHSRGALGGATPPGTIPPNAANYWSFFPAAFSARARAFALWMSSLRLACMSILVHARR